MSFISSTTFFWNIYILRRTERDMTKISSHFHVKYPLFLSEFTETWIPQHIFEKYTNIKFNEIPSNGRRVVPWGQTDCRTDMTKLIFVFQNFANAPTNAAWYTTNFLRTLSYWELDEKEGGHVYRFCTSVIRNKVASPKNYIRIFKVLLIIVFVVYNPNVIICFIKRDL
jgi:hypothetical protein